MAAVLEIIFLCVSIIFVAASDSTKEDNLDTGRVSNRGGLWFGPRLGKRSLPIDDEDRGEVLHRLLEAADSLKYYYDQLPYEVSLNEPRSKGSKKVIFTPKLGRDIDDYPDKRRHETVEFTPRLGRRKLSEDLFIPTMEEISEPMSRIARAPHIFSPRLGRSYYNLSPRLGRDFSDSQYSQPERRVERSVNVTK